MPDLISDRNGISLKTSDTILVESIYKLFSRIVVFDTA